MHSTLVMKHKGSISQTYLERDDVEIPRLYKRARQIATYPTTVMRLFEIAAELPVKKYYISDYAAYEYLRQRFFHNKKITFRSHYKQRLFDALYQDVKKMMEQEKYQKMGLMNTTILALGRPAPCIGLSPFVILQRYSLKHSFKNKVIIGP